MGKALTILSEIQKKLEAPKSQYNSFGKYHYRSAEDILDGLKHVMPPDCAVTLDDDISMISDRVYVKVTATFLYGEEKISVSAFAREPIDKKGMDDSQITGSTSSYARKYALNGLFAIDDSKDADATNEHGQQQKSVQKHQQKQQQVNSKDTVLAQLRHICKTPTGLAAVTEAAGRLGIVDLATLHNMDDKKLTDIRDAANEMESGL